MMHKSIFILFLIVIVYGMYNTLKKSDIRKSISSQTCILCRTEHEKRDFIIRELSQINSAEYVKNYIVQVINHGSDTLGFKGRVMEGGFASKEDAPKIACYVLEMSGRKCPHDYPKDAAMFYTSICGGCHGNDGKGIDGKYPDLTRKKLLGIANREKFLKEQLQKLQQQRHYNH